MISSLTRADIASTSFVAKVSSRSSGVMPGGIGRWGGWQPPPAHARLYLFRSWTDCLSRPDPPGQLRRPSGSFVRLSADPTCGTRAKTTLFARRQGLQLPSLRAKRRRRLCANKLERELKPRQVRLLIRPIATARRAPVEPGVLVVKHDLEVLRRIPRPPGSVGLRFSR